MQRLAQLWYRSSLSLALLPLVPFSWLFAALVAARTFCYKMGIFKSYRFDVPVIVVGNITVGGTGKTPFVIWLANFLQAQGYHPGIVSRGVGGLKHKTPHHVTPGDETLYVGDEAILLQQKSNCPVVICTNRVLAVAELLTKHQSNVVLCDDGLQHYRLQREIEIAIVDGKRGQGNRYLLPAGPLRESSKRLKKIDYVLVNGGKEGYVIEYEPLNLVNLKNQKQLSIKAFPHKKIHAVAGIGHPERFFTMLTTAGFEVIPHVFADHFAYRKEDLIFNDDFPIIMTEKDAVKCHDFATEGCWYLPISVKIDESFMRNFLTKLKTRG